MNVKHGISTLNRLLGKKNKSNHLSKSTTNLNLSVPSHIDNTSSQLEQNRITPLPVAATNAPFEQTFRITVLLPKGQLYVARLGAKTKLEKLLEIVCENKQLDQEKYEFRHPVDSSQVFNCELTIGAVGLNEIRLCHKSEAYDNFNADEIITLRHTGRESLSSSEFSSRNSKHTLKTASPYSSTNSLNSIDSTGMSTSYRSQMVSLPPLPSSARLYASKQNSIQPPVAPTRKKRAAPRPPSQNSIPEKEPISEVNGGVGNGYVQQEFRQPLPKKEFHVSSPNLTQPTEFTTLRSDDFHKSNISVDCNGNTCNKQNNNTTSPTNSTANISVSNVIPSAVSTPNGNLSNDRHSFRRSDSRSSTGSNGFQKFNIRTRPVSMSAISDALNHSVTENELSGNENGEESRGENGNSVNGSTETLKIPEPTPRKRMIAAKKKAPAPPPRGFPVPVALPRNGSMSKDHEETDKIKENVIESQKPKLNGSLLNGNISLGEVLVNESCEPNQSHTQEKVNQGNVEDLEENSSSVSPPQSLPHSPLDTSENCVKSTTTFENSSDEEEQIKVYNLKLGKTIVKPLTEHKTFEDLTVISSSSNELTVPNGTENNSVRSASPAWEYPIPAPPNFADENGRTKTEICKKESASSTNSSVVSNSPEISLIQEKTVDKPKVTQTILETVIVKESSETITSDIEDGYRGGIEKNEYQKNIDLNNSKDVKKAKLGLDEGDYIKNQDSIESNRNDVFTELNNVLNKQKLDEVISRIENPKEIESAKPNILSNFKIQTYNTNTGSTNISDERLSSQELIENEKNIEKSTVLPSKEEIILNKEEPSNLLVEQEVSEKKNEFNTQRTIKSSSTENKLEEPISISFVREEILINSNSTNKQMNEERISIQFDANPKSEETPFTSKKEFTSKQYKEALPEEERLYKKRSNLNSLSNGPNTPQIFKSRVNITRSDSFHSTRYPKSIDANYGMMSSRSSSYVSLLTAQNFDQKTNLHNNFADTNRRKSSSELSIGESPSLQSLIVMKSILNSRKNSLNSENDLQNRVQFESKPYANGYRGNSKETAPKLISAPATAYDCDSSKENSPKNKILSQDVNSQESMINHRKEEPEKKWKYQGPPSINLSSWSERPKIQVSIKNDGDYKFGIGGGGIGGTSTSITTFPRVYRNSTSNITPQSQHQHQHHQGEISSTQINPVRIINEQPKVPFIRSVEYKKPTPVDSSTEANSIVYIKPMNSVTTSTTMTLGRMPKMINRTASFAPTVKGFRKPHIENGFHHTKTESTTVDDSNATPETNGLDQNSYQPQKINLQTWKNSGSGVARSNSIITTYLTKVPTQNNDLKLPYANQNGHNVTNGTNNSKDVEENPFSKIVLRKTGLKEKIMSSDNDTEMSSKPSTLKAEENCVKLQLKLTTTVPQNPKKQQTTQPPPPPPIIRSVVTKQNAHSKISGGDPRDELLSAIRNFNKDALKKS